MAQLSDSDFEDEFPNISNLAQKETVKSVCELFNFYEYSLAYVDIKNTAYFLNRQKHLLFLENALIHPSLGNSYDINRTWIVYWVLHSMELLSVPPPSHLIKDCQNKSGGFGGGPGHISHATATYGAILSLAILGWYDESAYDVIDRPALHNWLKKLRQNDGSFLVHVDGECDVRGIYCAVVVATLTGVHGLSFFEDSVNYLVQCQTYEGGLGASPGSEAHGGYTYCGLAALVLLKSAQLLDLESLLEWTCHRQLSTEGAFQGRTNKLVDGCYSWWQGSALSILDELLINPDLYLQNSPFGDYYLNLSDEEIQRLVSNTDDSSLCNFPNSSALKIQPQAFPFAPKNILWNSNMVNLDPALPWNGKLGSWIFDQLALQKYILLCSQDLNRGGLRDKPKTESDYYHTCYVLSGLSVSQNNASYMTSHPTILLNEQKCSPNLLEKTDLIFNVNSKKVLKTRLHFSKMHTTS